MWCEKMYILQLILLYFCWCAHIAGHSWPCDGGEGEVQCTGFPDICTYDQLLCDGVADCPDGVDERDCTPANCRDDQFPCPNHQRICTPKTFLCDGHGHCPDSSDENNCRPENCTADQVYCPKGFCRPRSKKCGGGNICEDLYNEENCRPEDCTADEIYCPKGFCRPKGGRCDGTNNCNDWSDEENCPERKCREGEFRCLNGRCIHLGSKCDGWNACGDWSDELNCRMFCGFGMRCPDGRCIHSYYMCNGFNDCGDWADEDGCNKPQMVCDRGWHYDRGRCFKIRISDKDISWQDAQRQCLDTDTTLASVTGPRDEKFLVDILYSTSSPVYIGLQKDNKNAVGTFQSKFNWEDGSSITYENWRKREPGGGELEHCTVMIGVDGWKDIFCAEYATRLFVCMKYVFADENGILLPPGLTIKNSSVGHNWLKSCNSGELTSKFKFCDGHKDCRDGSDEEKCDASCKDSQYLCENRECVSLSFYCDGIDDCGDKSDEKNCEMKACSEFEWACTNGQCVEESKRCDMRFDCYDETDEADCGDHCGGFRCFEGQCIPHSWVNDGKVDCGGHLREDETGPVRGEKTVCLYGADEYGKVSFGLPPGKSDCVSFKCPDTYYKCPFSYCIPVMFVCNGKRDCPSGEDELYCNRYVCHKRYRCKAQSFCIDPQQLCDGLRHCPMGDDERYCPLPSACPPSCECDGRVIRCGQNFTLQTTFPSDVRKLNLTGVIIQNGSLDLSDLHYLTILDLSYCQLTTVVGLLVNNTNVIYLDLSNNAIQQVSEDSISSLKELRHLDLSNNILLTVEKGAFSQLSSLQYLYLTNSSFGDLNSKSFTGLSSLVKLSMANSSIEKIEGKPFMNMTALRSLGLQHNHIEQFSCCFLKHLESLQNMLTHSYRFCCDYMRPKSLTPDNCTATLSDAISSCKDLLGTGALKAMLWIIVLFAMVGNIAVLAYRIKYDRQALKRSYGLFVTNLSISDCLMGVYMLIIGGADAEYRDKYVSEDYGWRHGSVCKFAGFLCVLSSEASCLFISLITIDRFLAIKYPFGDIKITRRMTVITSVITWIVAVLLAAVPLLPSLSHWKLYSRNSVCLALPLSSEKTSGWQYSTAIFIGLNSILFLFVGVGQTFIFRELKVMPTIRTGKSDDAKVAWRLFLVFITDFFCWVPVGVMGIMSLAGIAINKEVFSWTAVAVLPFNSALNPLLYTLPGMTETLRKSKKKKAKAGIKEALPRESPLPNHTSVRNTRRYVGRRTEDMDTLGGVMRSREMSHGAKCELIGFITISIHELKKRNRNFDAVTSKNIFVSKCGEEITAVCFAMEPDEGRRRQVDDIAYLTRLLFDSTRKRKGDRGRGEMPGKICMRRSPLSIQAEPANPANVKDEALFEGTTPLK